MKIRAEWFWAVVVAIMVIVAGATWWIVDAEGRAEWPAAAKSLEDAIWWSCRLDLAQNIFDYHVAVNNLEAERLAVAAARGSPLVGIYHRISGDETVVGKFELTVYLVPRDGGWLDTRDQPLHHGVVAVDPKFFPHDSLIYIPALRKFDALFAPTYTLQPPPELKKAVEEPVVVLADATVTQIKLHPNEPIIIELSDPLGVEPENNEHAETAAADDMAADVYRARCHGWFVVRDTGAKVKGRKIDVAVFSEAAYTYIATHFPRLRDKASKKWRNEVEVYRLRNDPKWNVKPLDTWKAKQKPSKNILYD